MSGATGSLCSPPRDRSAGRVPCVVCVRGNPSLRLTLRRRREPAIEAVNAAIKAAGERISGKVKVTAYDGLAPAPVAPGTADALVFPAGVRLAGLPLEELPAAVVAALAGESAPRGEQVAGMTLFVCCHAKRDERCGHVGPALAAKLAELAAGKQAPGGGAISVLKTSHVGGHKASRSGLAGNMQAHAGRQAWHGSTAICIWRRCSCWHTARSMPLLRVLSRPILCAPRSDSAVHTFPHWAPALACLQYAGNVLAYCRGQATDGDWFGGVNARNAEAFLQALLAAKV